MSQASEMAGKNDGTYFLAGTQAVALGTTGGGHRSIALARYTPSGLDTSFSNDGMTTRDFGTVNANVTALAVDAFGRPVVAGYTSQ